MGLGREVGVAAIAAALAFGGSYFVTDWQVDSALDSAKDDRLRVHDAALEGFRQSVITLAAVLDDQTEPDGNTSEQTDANTAALSSLRSSAIDARTTASGDLDGAGTVNDCDAVVLQAADSLLAIPITGPLSWDEVSGSFVDGGSAPADLANIDDQLDLLIATIVDVEAGIDDVIADREPEEVSCEGLHPKPVVG